MANNSNYRNKKNIPELSKSAYNLLKFHRYEEAEKVFNQILGMDETNIYALVGIGDTKRQRKDFNNAINDYEKALIVEPVNKFALIGLADCYRGLKEYKKAINIWEKFLSFSENEFDISVLSRLGDTYKKLGNYEKALYFYLKAYSIDENNPYVLSGLGFTYFKKGDFKTSSKYWEKLYNNKTDLKPEDVRIITNLGNSYRKQRRYNDALKFFYQALKIEEDNFYALYGIADCYRGMKDYRKAVSYWKRILNKDPNNKKILTRIGDGYRKLGDYLTAKEYYQRAIEKDFDYYALIGLTMINMKENNITAAIENLNQLRNLSGLNHKIALLLSECYISLNDYNNAINILKDAVSNGITDNEIRNKIRLLKKSNPQGWNNY